MSKNIYNTPTAQNFMNEKMISSIANYLVRVSYSVVGEQQQQDIFKNTSNFNSLLSTMFNNCLKTNKQELFTLMTPPKNIPIPEPFHIITLGSIPFDVFLLSEVYPKDMVGLNGFGEYNSKIILNTNNYMRSTLVFTDAIEFQHQFVRNILIRSYYQVHNNWLAKNIIKVIGRLYGLVLSNTIGALFNLEKPTQQQMIVIFTHFWLRHFMTQKDTNNLLRLMNTQLFFPDTDVINTTIEKIEELHKNGMETLENVFEVITPLLPQRAFISNQLLVARLQKLGPDIISSSMALNFPPYFVYLVLLGLSDIKIGLSFKMKDMLSKADRYELINYFKYENNTCLRNVF